MNIIKNINWKVRLRNPIFWTTIIPAAVSFVYCVLGAFGVVPALTESMVLNIATAIITALTTLGVLVDPTTAGVKDSALALTYGAPRKDDFSEEEGIEK
ncbi:MAG: phage holin [Oscillospiraceae bacterium]|nr:phage holin [Oscillospiraceae bacterium]